VTVEIKELPGGRTSIRNGAVTSTVATENVVQYSAWHADGERRFGPDMLDWRFVCPNCGDVASVREFPEDSRNAAGAECIGRSAPGRGCNWAAGGLFAGPAWVLRTVAGEVRAIPVFRFAALASS
jgi:hypothetical protein